MHNTRAAGTNSPTRRFRTATRPRRRIPDCANTLVTTPNADMIFAMTYLDLKKDGLLVVTAPPPPARAYHGCLTARSDCRRLAGPDESQSRLGPIPNGNYNSTAQPI